MFASRCQSEDPAVRWQLNLYRDRALRFEGPPDPEKVLDRIQRISAAVFNLEQVRLYSFHSVVGGVASPDVRCAAAVTVCSVQVEQPLRSKKCVWQKLLSKQRKRAVVACFRMAPLYNLPRYAPSSSSFLA